MLTISRRFLWTRRSDTCDSTRSQYVFDFLHPLSGESNGAGGHSVTASVGNFPALVGSGMAMTIGFLGPCGYNSPHVHPRATEFNFAVNGTLQTGFLSENGARFVFNEVPPGSATFFPKGVIHFEMNNGCGSSYPLIFIFELSVIGVQMMSSSLLLSTMRILASIRSPNDVSDIQPFTYTMF